jgi:hypothetical protein
MKQSIPMFFTSNSESVVTDFDKQGFRAVFSPPISIPAQAKQGSCKITLLNASVWNTYKNVSGATEANNSKFFFQYPVTNNVLTDSEWRNQHVIELPRGNYSLNAIDTYIRGALRDFQYNGSTLIPDFVYGETAAQSDFTFTPNWANETVSITNKKIRVKLLDNFPIIIGYNIGDIIPPSSSTIYGPNIAQLSVMTSLVLHSSCGESLVDAISSDAIALFTLANTQASSLYFYEAKYPIFVDASYMIGRPFNDMSFYLTNEKNERLISDSEFSITVLIQYEI